MRPILKDILLVVLTLAVLLSLALHYYHFTSMNNVYDSLNQIYNLMLDMIGGEPVSEGHGNYI